jgi:hypothetical protein
MKPLNIIYTITIVASVFLMSCKKDIESVDLSSIPDSQLNSIYSYSGQCAAPEYFGDSGSGCIRSVQLVRFNDGNYFYSVAMGAGQNWETSGYISALTPQWTGSVYFYSGITMHQYVFSIDLGFSPPLMEAVFDRNGNLSDMSAKIITLVKE